MFKAKVIHVGGESIGIVIPKNIAEPLKLKKGNHVVVEIKKVKK
jgi:antitoxin component of MazEF toxin-antitoxin module